jgi:hypothetical protein
MAAFKITRTGTRAALAVLQVAVVVCATVSLVIGQSRPAPGRAPAPTTTSIAPYGLPFGAASCPVIYADIKTSYRLGASGTAVTSCGFVEEVRRAYGIQALTTSTANPVTVASPVTRKAYELMCVNDGAHVTCVGGEDAVVYLYNN